jgi:antitoxin (DNA-binding transcriptional repressor) of toxin-antitoxin stability system
MTSITIRDLRHKWPQAEALLQDLGELLVTRDARPIAKLVRLEPAQSLRKRFDPDEHAAWQKRTFGATKHQIVATLMTEDRAER